MRIERIPADVDEATFTDLGTFLVRHSRELVPAPVDMNTAMTNGYGAISEGMTLVARKNDGEIVGTLALRETELAWCADPARKCLVDYWFVIDEEHRGGEARLLLMEHAKEIGAERNLPVFVFKRVRIR